MPLFSFPFVRLSFAPAPSSFALLKTIVRSGKLILGKRVSKAGSAVGRSALAGKRQGIEYREQPARGGSWSPPLRQKKGARIEHPPRRVRWAVYRKPRIPRKLIGRALAFRYVSSDMEA